MATHDYVISNASGAAVRADLNNALAAIVSNNSNATEPSTTYAYQWWADTGSSPAVMKLRNAANDAWIELFQLDGETGVSIPSADVVAISTGGTERMRITDAGQIFLGCTSQPSSTVGGSAFVPAANSRMVWYASTTITAGQKHALFLNPNGEVGSISTNGSATVYTTSSDYRLKENVTAVADSITRLQQLKPSRFNFIADPDTTVDGFIAHEVQDVVPEAITGEKDAVDDEGNPQYQGIDQSKLVPLLTAALQEAVAKIETLEARVAALEGA